MEINEELKKECMDICKCYRVKIDFDNKDWENEFIERISWQNKFNWYDISIYQKLSEDFIEKFENKVDWYCISIHQKLSEDFIEKFQDKVDWNYVLYHQVLSESFIEKFQDKIDWNCVLYHQVLSESFIEKYIDRFNKKEISRSQRISREFAKKHNIEILEDNWYHKSYEWKLKFIKENTNYEILNDDDGDYIIAYKAIRTDNKSFVKPNNYKYIVREIYESNCDCDMKDKYSYGLAAWDKENAIEFGKPDNFKLIKVKIYINDIGAIIKNNNSKIRCFKFQVVEDLGVYEYGNE